ncbi:MAG: LacI family transcriptional regulator [Paenibacillus sp.]|jgi:LacI family transcriptional regulator|nr:LacI family transcriptional regulator [Paenibacillus sp.]
MTKGAVDGVIIVPTGDKSLCHLRKLAKRKIPFILLDRYEEDIAADVVMGDNADTVRQLVNHLIQQGHRKIALINGPAYVSNACERQRAFEEVLLLDGISCRPNLIIETHFKQDNLQDILFGLLSLAPVDRPIAILAANNFIGVNTIRALRELNIRVPDDIAVACFDDPEPLPDYDPFLTVAAQPAYDTGYLSAQLLIERIEQIAPRNDYSKINNFINCS